MPRAQGWVAISSRASRVIGTPSGESAIAPTVAAVAPPTTTLRLESFAIALLIIGPPWLGAPALAVVESACSGPTLHQTLRVRNSDFPAPGEGSGLSFRARLANARRHGRSAVPTLVAAARRRPVP